MSPNCWHIDEDSGTTTILSIDWQDYWILGALERWKAPRTVQVLRHGTQWRSSGRMTEVREVTSLVVCERSHSEGTDVFAWHYSRVSVRYFFVSLMMIWRLIERCEELRWCRLLITDGLIWHLIMLWHHVMTIACWAGQNFFVLRLWNFFIVLSMLFWLKWCEHVVRSRASGGSATISPSE